MISYNIVGMLLVTMGYLVLTCFLLVQAASAFETVRDIVAASHLVGNMRGSTLDDPLAECYKKLGCSILPLENDSDDYKMVVNYLEKTYEPVKVGDIVWVAYYYFISIYIC